ncbi:hypothetical protein M0805_009588 [Coniferiporia weirii]|nr:hypothetical protein M0805_009588 [Coniferiporia weirii]
MSTPPATQLGVLTTSPTSYTLQTFPIPTPGPGEVLIRNVAVAANPKDYKLPPDAEDYAFIEGNDVAGYVVESGEQALEYEAGERVAAFTKMRMKDNKYGGYAQYSVAPESTTFRIPHSTTFEEASTLPLAVMTAAIGLFVVLGLPEPPADTSCAPDNGNGIVIYGASSSVGAYAVQLAKRAGFFVVGVAGESTEYVKSIGADVVIDYRAHQEEGELESVLVDALSGRPTSVAFDAITLYGSTLLLARVLSHTAPDGKGVVTYLLHTFLEHDQLPDGVEARLTYVASAYLLDEVFARRFYRQISAYLVPSATNTRSLQPNRVRLMPNGLASVPDGIELLINGEVHAEKLVYRVAETPGLALKQEE